MDPRLSMILVLTLSVITSTIKVVESSSSIYNDNHRFYHPQLSMMVHGNHATATRPRKCNNGLAVGDCASGDDDEEMAMESSGISRRVLMQTRYISYAALAADSVPCRVRGNSYYNCLPHQSVNPYRRGCTAITHCARG